MVVKYSGRGKIGSLFEVSLNSRLAFEYCNWGGALVKLAKWRNFLASKARLSWPDFLDVFVHNWPLVFGFSSQQHKEVPESVSLISIHLEQPLNFCLNDY